MKRFHFVFAGLIVLSLVLCGCSRQGERSKIAEKWVENETAAASSHDVEKQISFYTDDLLYEDLALNKTFHGKEEFSVFIKGIVTTIPDLKVVAKSFFVSGNKVCIEGILSGTYRGNIPPAVGKTFSVRCAHICELRDGKAFRVTDYYDRASIQRQLGIQTQAIAADPFVGTWKMDVAKSKATDPSAMVKSETIKYSAKDNGIKLTFDGVSLEGQAYHVEASYIFDGKDYPVKGYPMADMSSAKKIDTNTILIVNKKAGKEVEKWQFAVSRDGKTWTSTGNGVTLKGQAYTGTFPYDKQ